MLWCTCLPPYYLLTSIPHALSLKEHHANTIYKTIVCWSCFGEGHLKVWQNNAVSSWSEESIGSFYTEYCIQNKIKEKYIMSQENIQEVCGDYTNKYDMWKCLKSSLYQFLLTCKVHQSHLKYKLKKLHRIFQEYSARDYCIYFLFQMFGNCYTLKGRIYVKDT
jgi:hypothetical protein